MKATLGILGVGGLAGSLVRGLAGSGHRLVLSPRNIDRSAALSESHSATIATSNQDVVDRSDAVLVCLPAPVGAEALARLAFRPDQTVLSVMAGVGHRRVVEAVTPAHAFLSMMPGYANALGLGPCLLYPHDAFWEEVLARLGKVMMFTDEGPFTAASTFGAFSGAALEFMGQMIAWFEARGLTPVEARTLVAETLRGNAEVLLRDPAGLREISTLVTTPGGITTQLVHLLEERAAIGAWCDGMDAVHERLLGPD